MLARTDWNVPKHEGLTMFLVPFCTPASPCAASPRSTATRSSARSSSTGSNSAMTPSWVRSTTAGPWPRASCITSGARSAADPNSPAAQGPRTPARCRLDHVGLAEATGQGGDARVQDLAGRALARRIVEDQLIDHVSRSIADGSLPPNAGTLIRLFHAETTELEVDTALAISRHRRGDRRGQRPAGDRRALPVPADRFAGRRQLRDGPQCDQRAGARLPARTGRRPRCAVQLRSNATRG